MILEKNDFEKIFKSEIIMNIYVMGITQVDLLDIVQVKVGFFAVLKMCIGVIGVHLEKFV